MYFRYSEILQLSWRKKSLVFSKRRNLTIGRQKPKKQSVSYLGKTKRWSTFSITLINRMQDQKKKEKKKEKIKL